MSQVVHLAFHGRDVAFRDDGWFNATVAAAGFGKRLQDYLDNLETRAYVDALQVALNHADQRDLIRASRGRGGGTWFHPKLAVHFARWLNIEFAVWCDIQIDNLIRGGGDHLRARHAAASSHKVMSQVLQAVRMADGKETAGFHYGNESKLVNWASGGRFEGLDRDAMTAAELDLLAEREIQNAVMIGSRIPYLERKAIFSQTRELPPAGRELPARTPRKKLGKAA
ncbi:KilA-N domain-containing protein [Stenotrophomonas sp. 278]|uniref:KilA-N domain-containing protein n=1 Tax=Stenotrophomonas sp. 278 TaxID=2479851 RepID=UPI000F68192F|nr:KilA-N domain-containing protein [Stenotrophomonas sp. 278]RRU05591.1 KilA-N domain-containing protein [Stenotrophomonas sp. 278]